MRVIAEESCLYVPGPGTAPTLFEGKHVLTGRGAIVHEILGSFPPFRNNLSTSRISPRLPVELENAFRSSLAYMDHDGPFVNTKSRRFVYLVGQGVDEEVSTVFRSWPPQLQPRPEQGNVGWEFLMVVGLAYVPGAGVSNVGLATFTRGRMVHFGASALHVPTLALTSGPSSV